MRLDKSEKQCPKIQSNFYLDQEKMEVYGDFWHSTWDDKYMDFGEEVYIKYKINENKENKLSASVFKEKGYRQKSHTIDIFKKNDNFEIVTFWDYKPFKKGPWVWRSYNCEIVDSNIGKLK